MSSRTDLPAILTRALLAAAAPLAQKVHPAEIPSDLFPEKVTREEAPGDLAGTSDDAHRLMANLITLLLLELNGIVESPLNRRTRTRMRLGAPSGSRILAEWATPAREGTERELFGPSRATPPLPMAPNPEEFFRQILHSARTVAARLSLAHLTIEEMIRWLLPVIARCAPEDDPVGWIHSHAQRHRLLRGPGSRLRFQVDRVRGRSQGVLYTPPPLTEALVDAVLSSWSQIQAPASTPLFGSSPRSPRPALQILDPSCGSGQFLLSIARRLLPDGPARPEETLQIFRSMHGVDIDPGAATLGAFNLSLQVVRALCRSQGADPSIVVPWLLDEIGPGFPWFLGTQIHQGNALLLAPTPERAAFRWTDRFASIFDGERPGFDIVIGNPPWVSYGLRDRAGAEEEEASYLRRIYTFGAQYKLSLYPLFIELALRLTRPGGLHGFLVPDSFLTGRHSSRIRAHLLETSQPLLFCLVESGPWPGVHVGRTAFYCVRRLPAPSTSTLVATSVLQLPSPLRRRKQPPPKFPLFSVQDERREPVFVDASVFRTTPHHAFRIYRDDRERRFAEALERAPLRFDDLVETYSGLIARYGQHTVIGPRDGEFLLQEPSGRMAMRDPNPQPRWRPALHSGAEVEPFRIRWRGGTLYIPEDRTALRLVYKSGFDVERYVTPKVFLRQTGDHLIAARDQQGLFCLNNVHILASKPAPEIDLWFLCGLTLSEPIQRYYQSVALEAGRPLAQVDLVTVRSLPFPCDLTGRAFGEKVSLAQGAQGPARGVLSRVDRALVGGRSEEILEIVQKAYRAAADPFTLGEDLRGRDVATMVVNHIVRKLEKTRDSKVRTAGLDALDGSIRILFALDVQDAAAPCPGSGSGPQGPAPSPRGSSGGSQ